MDADTFHLHIEQMKDNISYMKNFKPLNDEEQKIIQKAQRILGESSTIPCTACHYCTEGCPKQIPINEDVHLKELADKIWDRNEKRGQRRKPPQLPVLLILN